MGRGEEGFGGTINEIGCRAALSRTSVRRDLAQRNASIYYVAATRDSLRLTATEHIATNLEHGTLVFR